MLRHEQAVRVGRAALASLLVFVGCGVSGQEPTRGGEQAGGHQTGGQRVTATMNDGANSLNLDLVSQVGGLVHAVAHNDDRLYVGTGPRLLAYAADDPLALQPIAESEILGHVVRNIAVAEGQAFLALGPAGIAVVDLTASDLPVIGAFDTEGEAYAVDVHGTLAHVADRDNGLVILDVSSPQAIRQVGHLDAGTKLVDVSVRDGIAYLVSRKNGLLTADVADPAAPRLLGGYDHDGAALRVTLIENTAYVVNDYALWVVDVTDPAEPQEIRRFQPEGYGSYDEEIAADLVVEGDYAYVSGGSLLRLEVGDPADPRVDAVIESIGGGDLALGAGGALYAATGTNLAVLDLSIPSGPAVVARHAGAVAHSWQSPLALGPGGYLYVGSERVDISDPAQPRHAGTSALNIEAGVVFHGDLAFVPDPFGRGSVRIYDASRPEQPERVGDLAPVISRPPDSGLPLVEVIAVDDLVVTSDRAVVVGGYQGFGCPALGVADISDPSDPSMMGWAEWDHLSFNVQGLGVSDDAATVFITGGDSRCDVIREPSQGYLSIFGISAGGSFDLLGELTFPETASDVQRHGHHLYVAASGAGLRVVDIADPAHPIEVGVLPYGDDAEGVHVTWPFAFVGYGGRIQAADVSNPAEPTTIESLIVPGDVRDMLVVGDYLWVSSHEAGLLGYAMRR